MGQGADLFDVQGFGADFAYTVDGGDVNEVNYENFNAAAAVVTVHGFSVHPGSAKDKMKNAMNIAIEFHNALPEFDRPEHTEGYEGFYHLTSMVGDVTTAKLGYIVRDHDAARFTSRKAEMAHIAARLNDRYGEGCRRAGPAGQLLQYDREDPAPLPSHRKRPHRSAQGWP